MEESNNGKNNYKINNTIYAGSIVTDGIVYLELFEEYKKISKEGGGKPWRKPQLHHKDKSGMCTQK